MKANPYLPSLATIDGIKEEVEGKRAIKTFRLKFLDEKNKKRTKNKNNIFSEFFW